MDFVVGTNLTFLQAMLAFLSALEHNAPHE
jgi:hypothetical protein